jgi:hypothetical protein
LAGKKMNMSLTAKDDIPKNSAIPPQTPDIDLSVEDFLNLLFNLITPSKKKHITIK